MLRFEADHGQVVSFTYCYPDLFNNGEEITRTIVILALSSTFGGVTAEGMSGVYVVKEPRKGCDPANYFEIKYGDGEVGFVELDNMQSVSFRDRKKINLSAVELDDKNQLLEIKKRIRTIYSL